MRKRKEERKKEKFQTKENKPLRVCKKRPKTEK